MSDTADLMLFDGRDRAQNGWFVLRSLIPSGKTTGAIVWHIRPDVIPNWTRPPMIAHSQVGYAPGFSKVAVLELDPKYNGPKTAKVLRLTEDGSYKQVFEGADHTCDAVAALRVFEIRFHLGEGAGPLCNRVRGSTHGALSRFRRTSTQKSGRTAWTITLRSRWITLQFAKDTACGMALRTWTMGAWRRWLESNLTAGIRPPRRMGSTKAAITFLG